MADGLTGQKPANVHFTALGYRPLGQMVGDSVRRALEGPTGRP